jgi:hypothetical protein
MKPVLLGMNNEHPDRVFYPDNAACSGGRILSMMNLVEEISCEEFLDAFERHNMHYGKDWDAKAARANRLSVWETLFGKRVIIFGRQTASALGVPRADGEWKSAMGYFTFTTLPHPSGLTRDYNDPQFRLETGKLLWDALSLK